MTRKNGEKPLTEKEVKELERVESENYGLYDISKEQIWDVYGNGDSEMTCFPIPYKIETSSQLSNQNGINYSGENLFDNSFKTAWVEGREGYGIEEYIKFYINNIKLNKKNNDDYGMETIPDIMEINIFNGYVKSEKAWRENSRVKKLKMYVDGQLYVILELQDTSSEQKFDIPDINYLKIKKRGDYNEDMIIRFEIIEVYPGEKYKDTAITEITFLTKVE